MSRKLKTKASKAERQRPESTNKRFTLVGICIAILAITWIIYGQTLRHEFVNYDDDYIVINNPNVLAGLTLSSVKTAFTSYDCNFYAPLRLITHQLDYELFGLNAGGHHLVNVLLHSASALLLFIALLKMTGSVWRSAFVAVVFAIHPLHVESVAWASERKDTLSGLFFMLTLLAYVGYVRKPKPVRYMGMLILFAAGLLSKPTLVTLPFLLLLLDYWPLSRFEQKGRWKALVWEKVPLIALSIAACIVAVKAQDEAVASFEQLPLFPRIINACVSYLIYIKQTFVPIGLAPYYPYSVQGFSMFEMILAFAVLLGGSVGAFVFIRSRPYLFVGWFWFVGILVPVSGVVQVGDFAHADRFMYLPQIGLTIAIAWGISNLTAKWPQRSAILGGAMVVTLAALMFAAFKQTSYWHDSGSLWKHAISCTSDNAFARHCLGTSYLEHDHLDAAIKEFEAAVALNPNSAENRGFLGKALLWNEDIDAAILQFTKAVELNSTLGSAHSDLASALIKKGRWDEAIDHYRKVVQLEPNSAAALIDLSAALTDTNQTDEAMAVSRRALEIKPDSASAYFILGNCLLKKERLNEAIKEFETAVRFEPSPMILRTLASAYAQSGKAIEASETAEKAAILAEAQGNSALASEIRAEMNNNYR